MSRPRVVFREDDIVLASILVELFADEHIDVSRSARPSRKFRRLWTITRARSSSPIAGLTTHAGKSAPSK